MHFEPLVVGDELLVDIADAVEGAGLLALAVGAFAGRGRSSTPVRAIAELWKFGVTPEEIVMRLPHVTLGQVFDALSYYQDHCEEIEQDILRNRVPDTLIDPRLQ